MSPSTSSSELKVSEQEDFFSSPRCKNEKRTYNNFQRYHMELKQRVEQEIKRLNPKWEELAKGEVELISVDEETATVTLRIYGGRLH